MKINNLMKTKVKFTTPKSTAKDAAFLMHEEHVGALPVMKKGKLVGIITDRDICCKVVAAGYDAAETPVEDVMTKNVTTCFDDQSLDDAANIMIQHHIRRLAVLNHENSMVGFISVYDLAGNSHELASSVLEASSLQTKRTAAWG